jgi:hypothetical protein
MWVMKKLRDKLKIRIVITPKEKEELIALLRDYVDFFFAWPYKEMLGLHRVPLVEGCKSVKQRLRMTNPNVLIKVNVEKQWNADFLEVVKYPR